MTKTNRKRQKPTRGKRLIRNIALIIVFVLIFTFFYPVHLTREGAIKAGLENIHITDADIMLIEQQGESRYIHRAFAGNDNHIFMLGIGRGLYLYSNARIIDTIINDKESAISFKQEYINWGYDDGGDTTESFVATYDRTSVLTGFVNDERIKKVEVVTNSENSPFVTEDFTDGRFVLKFNTGKVIDSCSLDRLKEFIGYDNVDYLEVNGYDADGNLIASYGPAEERSITVIERRFWTKTPSGEPEGYNNEILGYMFPSEGVIKWDERNK